VPSIFDDERYKKYESPLGARALESKQFLDWYTGDIYKTKTVAFGQLGEFQASVKALYHPIARAVDLHAAFLPGFPAYAFTRDIKDGNGQLTQQGTRPETVSQIQKLLQWSRWPEYGPLYNMNYALKGRSIVSVTNREGIDPLRPVVFEVRDPANTYLDFADRWSRFPNVMITVIAGAKVPDREEAGQLAYVYTDDEILTFFEGAPYSYVDPVTGLEIYTAQAPNSYGFVPAVESRFGDIGNGAVRSAFSGVLPLIVTINRMATYIMGVMGTYFRPQMYIAGAERGDEDVEFGEGILYGPMDSEAKMLLADLDLPGATAFVAQVYKEVKANLPELIFDEIRGINRISTEGLELQFAELISKLTVSRAGQDRALNDIFRVGLWAAQEAGATDFSGYRGPDEDGYEDEPISLDPLRGYVPLGESALLAIQKQRVDVEEAQYKLEQMRLEGELRLEQMQQAMSQAGSSAPMNSSASNKSDQPNPQGSGPDATSPGPKQKADDGQPVER
jgi:hypothetical protein